MPEKKEEKSFLSPRKREKICKQKRVVLWTYGMCLILDSSGMQFEIVFAVLSLINQNIHYITCVYFSVPVFIHTVFSNINRDIGHKLLHIQAERIRNIVINHLNAKGVRVFSALNFISHPHIWSHTFWINANAFVIAVKRKNMTDFSNKLLRLGAFHFGLIENGKKKENEKRKTELCSWHDNICGTFSPAKSQWLILSTRVIWFSFQCKWLHPFDFRKFHFRA